TSLQVSVYIVEYRRQQAAKRVIRRPREPKASQALQGDAPMNRTAQHPDHTPSVLLRQVVGGQRTQHELDHISSDTSPLAIGGIRRVRRCLIASGMVVGKVP